MDQSQLARILIVDDDRRVVETIGSRLQSFGHACRGESHGERALEIVERGGVDLLVLDVMIPGLSGFEVCRRVRSNPKNFTIPIVFISAMDSQEEIQHGLSQGADDFISKPFNIDQVMKRIENLLVISANTLLTDDITELPAAKVIKHQVQSAINERRAFSLVYAEVMRTADLGRAIDNDARLRALRHFARAFNVASKQCELQGFSVGHLGGGHFLCLLDAGKGETLCREMDRVWQKHLPRFYRELDQEQAYVQARATARSGKTPPVPLLDAIYCTTHFEPGTALSAQDLLETLANMRKGALEGHGAGIYVDRRADIIRASA